jgi:DNA-binding transcriptional LysR family regulator
MRSRKIGLFVGTLEGTEILYDDPLVVVADARHPLVRRRSIELVELVNEAWTLPPSPIAQLFIQTLCAIAKPPPKAKRSTS